MEQTIRYLRNTIQGLDKNLEDTAEEISKLNQRRIQLIDESAQIAEARKDLYTSLLILQDLQEASEEPDPSAEQKPEESDGSV